MNWTTERESLEVLQNAPSTNSNLKKKLAIINKFRNIPNESFPQILEDIKSENLCKFYTEIINSLLSNGKIHTHEDIHKIIRIIHLYSYDPMFLANITTVIKKRYSDSWANGAIFAEIYYFMNKQVNGALKTILKSGVEGCAQLILYLLCNFENLDVSYIKNKILASVNKDSERNIEILGAIYTRLGIGIQLKAPNNYVEVIKPIEGEFSYYKSDVEDEISLINPKKSIDISSGNLIMQYIHMGSKSMPADIPAHYPKKNRSQQSILGLIKQIPEETENFAFLNLISTNIDGNSDMINKVLKKKKHISAIPAIARIISKLTRGKKEVVSQLLLEDIELISHNDLLLISELYKFNTIKLIELLNLLNRYLNKRLVGKFCILFENAGRYMLINKESNKPARDLIDRLKGLSITGIDKLFVGDCLSKIHQNVQLKIDILDFLHWFFKKENFVLSDFFNTILLSRKFMMLCFLQPEIFESEDMIVRVIKCAEMEETMINIYTDTLHMILKQSKQRAFGIVGVLGHLLYECDMQKQIYILDFVYKMNIPMSMKQRIVIMLLDHVDRSLHGKYTEMILNTPMSYEIRAKFFNFCEKYNYNAEVESNEDSFEAAMKIMGG